MTEQSGVKEGVGNDPLFLFRFPIDPIAAPRMTSALVARAVHYGTDNRSKSIKKYLDWKNDMALLAGQWLPPEADLWAVFQVPMPKSWSNKKKKAMAGQPHQQRPDVDNYKKALLDSFGEDSHIWDVRATKIWGEEGCIWIFENPYRGLDMLMQVKLHSTHD